VARQRPSMATAGPSLVPIQYDSQSPSPAPAAPATQTGQKLMPPCAIRVPRAIKTAQAGSTSEMNARDSPNASAPTIGGPAEFNNVLGDAVNLIFGRHGAYR
jgi:hypothetical protein